MIFGGMSGRPKAAHPNANARNALMAASKNENQSQMLKKRTGHPRTPDFGFFQPFYPPFRAHFTLLNAKTLTGKAAFDSATPSRWI